MIVWRFAVVAYRDFSDGAKQFETHDFSPFEEPAGSLEDTRRIDKGFMDSQRQSVNSFVQGLVAEGGGDLPEDVTGALDVAASLSWSARVRFLVVVGDAPAHGPECCGSDMRDDHPTHPKGLSVKGVIRRLCEQKHVRPFMCHVKATATQKMFQAWRSAHNSLDFDKKEKTRPEAINLFSEDPGTTEIRGAFHIIFVLDASGSMSGSPWTGVMNAYRLFVQKRMGGNQGQALDTVSVVVFDSTAQTQLSQATLTAANSASLRYTGGGTMFGPALSEALVQLQAADPRLTPMLLFMSDGCSCSSAPGNTEMQQIQRQFGRSRGLQVHTFAFGSADRNALEGLAQDGGGSFHVSPDASVLASQFVRIAAEAGAADGLIKQFAKQIGDAVADRLVLDYM
uniref:VWFA domain-containing protein n=1 Tax=Chromera velia CCMP2878 TaxID=1169474 RepID=A0A0G4GEJ0_9ALVE|eukprot:Cvel_21522.t1-p1 / transcript=Cvel_21522.t1 / gene=Cvel_21522 / organism=Chromera_velia_CCMP2878 / gene_product=hypothetical protein / transcript_product=hypothetical protein / location=Cvel_scaffold2026:25296-26719(-) / protein_length=395 / sequence_SO=supercontig / SO=protein_coding / is_pseudo=false